MDKKWPLLLSRANGTVDSSGCVWVGNRLHKIDVEQIQLVNQSYHMYRLSDK